MTSGAVTASFSSLETLQGGTGNDDFTVASAASINLLGGAGTDSFTVNAALTGSIDGEAGLDTLAGTAINQVVLVGSVFAGTEADITGGFASIEQLNGNGGSLQASIWMVIGL